MALGAYFLKSVIKLKAHFSVPGIQSNKAASVKTVHSNSREK